MDLIRTSLLNGTAVVVRMITMLGLNKILAVYVGPGAYASIGNFQNAIQMLSTLASGAINTGVTKYTAEYSSDAKQQKVIWKTAGSLSLVISIFISLFVFIFREKLASFFLKDVAYSSVFIWLSLSFVFFVLNLFFMALLNGKKEIRHYVISNIAGSILAFLAVCLLTIYWGLYGALVALSTYQSLSFLATLYICKRLCWFRLSDLFGRINKKAVINLGGFTAMALTSAICVPVSHMMIRSYVGNALSWEDAGYWEAMWRMSSAYLMLITTTLSVYYLPKLAELRTRKEIVREIFSGYQIILPFTLVLGVLIYLFRIEIVNLLFTENFHGMSVLFFWQVIGDFLKIGSWVLAYVMLSKAMIKPFIISEVFSSVLFVMSTYLLVPSVGLEGVAVAHALNYFVYWILVAAILFWRPGGLDA